MLRNLVKKFRSQTLKDEINCEKPQQLFEPRDSGTESDIEESVDTKSLAVSQTSDYRASQQSLFTTSSLAPSDQESNSWDSFGCESGIQVNYCESSSSFGAPHPTYFKSDFRGVVVSDFSAGIEEKVVAIANHSRLHSHSAFSPVAKQICCSAPPRSAPPGSDGFRSTYPPFCGQSGCSSEPNIGVAMLPPGCQLPEDIECCSAQEDGRHHDFLIPRSPADLENGEIQRNFERLQAEMQELVAKDPQSTSDARFADDSLDEEEDLSKLKDPERLVSPTAMIDAKPVGCVSASDSSVETVARHGAMGNDKSAGNCGTKSDQLGDQFSAKRKRSQSQGRSSIYPEPRGSGVGTSQQSATVRENSVSNSFSFLLRSAQKEAELSFPPDGSKCGSQGSAGSKLNGNDLQSAEVANITKASLRSGKVLSSGISGDRVPGDFELDSFKTVSGVASPPAREDQEVQELMNATSGSNSGGCPAEPRFFLRSSSCWKQTHSSTTPNALNAPQVKVESVEEKVTSVGASKDGCPYLFRFRPKRAPIKLLVPPQSPLYKNSLASSEPHGSSEMDKLSPRKRTRGEMAFAAAAVEQISAVNLRDSTTDQGAQLSTSLSDSSVGPRGTSEQRPTLNFDKMREKMNKANTKKHCSTIVNAKSKFRNFGSIGGRPSGGRNSGGGEPVGCSFRPVMSSNLSLPP